MSVQLIDGEVKAEYSPSASSLLVFHSAEQLTYKWSALSMLTTKNSITFYESHKDTDTGRIHITYCELPKYDLSPVQDLTVDLDKSLLDDGFVKEFEETHTNIIETWKVMRLEQKKMVLAILHAVDIIATYITSSADLEDAAAKRKEGYKRGFKEPFFLTTLEPDLKSRRPILTPKKVHMLHKNNRRFNECR